MATMTPEIQATIEAALREVKTNINAHATVVGHHHISEKRDRIDTALTWLDTLAAGEVDAPQPDSAQEMPRVQPDWSSAPEWAEWWAVDCGGGAGWYESEPELDHSGFWDRLVGMDGKCIGKTNGAGDIDIPLGVDWRLLKQRRPAPTPDSDLLDAYVGTGTAEDVLRDAATPDSSEEVDRG